VYDKEKEDQPFTAEHADVPTIDYNKPQLQIFKSVQSQNQKANPVSFWRVAKQRINSLAFSPDAKIIAAGTEGGRLYLIDPHREKILDLFLPLFGGIQAVCWSPDGRYILSGGQDDLVHLYSFDERELVARFQGHRGWVNWIAFDPWRCDGRNYRFGSVADDRRLLLWDFNASMLQRPRAVRNNTHISPFSSFFTLLQSTSHLKSFAQHSYHEFLNADASTGFYPTTSQRFLKYGHQKSL
jgi:WD40 repeat protein